MEFARWRSAAASAPGHVGARVEDFPQLPPVGVEDQRRVRALGAHALDDALGVGVGELHVPQDGANAFFLQQHLTLNRRWCEAVHWT